MASNLLIKTEDLDKEGETKSGKKLTRGLVRRMRNNNKDAEEGKYEEREISDLQPSYSASSDEGEDKVEEISDSSVDEEDGGDLMICNNLTSVRLSQLN